jgi:hypothetical protein
MQARAIPEDNQMIKSCVIESSHLDRFRGKAAARGPHKVHHLILKGSVCLHQVSLSTARSRLDTDES